MENVQSENQREFGSFLAYRWLIHVNHDLNLVNSGIVSGPSSPSITISPLALQPNPTFSFPDNPRPSWELKRREAVWDLFQSESAFLRDHLMALKNVRKSFYSTVVNVNISGLHGTSEEGSGWRICDVCRAWSSLWKSWWTLLCKMNSLIIVKY